MNELSYDRNEEICSYCNEDKAVEGKQYCIECLDQAEYEEEYV